MSVAAPDRRPAIAGGRPVRTEALPYGRQTIDERDVAAVVAALRSEWLTTGPRVAAFEEAFAAAVGARHAVAVSSGTAALHAAVFAAGVGPGDEVVTTPLTFAATANAVLYERGTPVFADVQRDTLAIDPAQVEAALAPRTRAIIGVDYAGTPVDVDRLRTLAESRRLVFIEDGAHALGAKWRGRPVGALAHLTTFSLHPVKHITTAEGGVITTDDPELAARMRLFRNHGITTDHRQRAATAEWAYEMVALGFNYRLSDLQAALGTSQLQRLDAWLERRRDLARLYDEAFAASPFVEPLTVPDAATPAWHIYPVRLRLDALRVDRREMFRALRAENIGVNVHYIPVPWHPYYRALGYARGGWPVAEGEYERLITLPLFPAMTAADARDVITAVDKVASYFQR